MAELVAGGGRLVGGHPEDAAVGVGLERAIVEILAQEAEFPELVGDVLAHVGDGAVGADDHFALFGKAGHDPAARVLALGLEVDGLAVLQEFERRGPEFQVKDVAFARQHVVFDVQAEHGRQVRLTMASATRCASSATSPSPASMSCSVALRQGRDSGWSL